jgi:hypothetical protein
MGCATSCEDSGLNDAVVQAAKIDEQLRVDKKNDERTIKILLLGKSPIAENICGGLTLHRRR